MCNVSYSTVQYSTAQHSTLEWLRKYMASTSPSGQIYNVRHGPVQVVSVLSLLQHRNVKCKTRGIGPGGAVRERRGAVGVGWGIVGRGSGVWGGVCSLDHAVQYWLLYCTGCSTVCRVCLGLFGAVWAIWAGWAYAIPSHPFCAFSPSHPKRGSQLGMRRRMG